MSPDNTQLPTFDDELTIADHFPRPLYETWQSEARKSLRGRPLESLEVRTHEDIVVGPVHTAEDVPYEWSEIGVTRGGPVEIVSPVDLRDPKGTIGRLVEALDHGADALWIWVDRRSSSWGRLTAGSFALFQEAARGAPIYLDGRGAAPALAALLMASARRLESGFENLRGGLDLDPLGVLAADGRLPSSLVGSIDQAADSLRWCEDHAPRMRTLAVSTLPHAKAGATAVQELAVSLATGIAYLRAMEQRGLQPELVCRRLRFVVAVGRDLFMEVAKLRALRMAWARITAVCGVAKGKAAVPIHAVASPRCLTVRDPWVNLLRGSASAYAAFVGGADMVTVMPFDAIAGTSDALANRIAVNTGLILREESRVDHVRDPAAGSYFVERLTADLCAAAWSEVQRIEAAGGMVGYLRSGALARELAEGLAAKRRAVTTLIDPVTGVSTFPNLEEEALERQRSRRDARRSPDDEKTDVHRVVGAEFGTFTSVLEAAHGGITAVELLDMLRGSDESERLSPVRTEREALPFEALRDAADRHLQRAGVRPRVFVASVGAPENNRSAIAFVTNLLAAGGLITVLSEGLEDPEAVGAAFTASGSRAAVICADEDRAAESVPLLAREFKALRARRVMVLGSPGRLAGAWREAGVDGFIQRHGDAVATLRGLLEAEGVEHV